MTEHYLTIRQMCEAYDVTPRTLRFYEAKELISPLRQGTRRLYTRRERARLKLILRGKRFGFSLEDIRQLLDLYDTSGQNLVQIQRAYELALERLGDMIRQRDELTVAINDLRQQMDWGNQVIASLTSSSSAAAQ
ncbi:MerR family DNA-binding transcriptional regulator [uncultured Boseongicola sp.]|uniref:MerR family transcriptional regulator n=1 Tax=uncultured Boseongicola sp. TaxID=1648499 RepID=UPI0026355307|nr:MerR family DNA-binding transcriptional regulator [uncultured Boseongicola sp.]